MTTDNVDKEKQARAEEYKEQGNQAFKQGHYPEAVTLYGKGLDCLGTDDIFRDIRSVCLKNRAAAYLKQEKWEDAVNDCDKALAIVPAEPKALYRRSQALYNLERYEESYRDATAVLRVEPNNAAVKKFISELHEIVQKRAIKNAQTSTKVEQMTAIAFDIKAEAEKRETATKNMVVLAKEKAGADIMIKTGIVQKIFKLLKVEKNNSIYLNCIRIIGQLCQGDVERVKEVLKICGIPWFLEILDSEDQERVSAAQHCMQQVLNAFSGMDNKPDSKPNQKLCDQYKSEIDTLLTCLTVSITNRTITGLARDAVMELVMKNCHYTALSWAERFVEIKGVLRLLEVCSELEEYKYESAMFISKSSRTIAAVCLSKIYENMYYDQAKERFTNQVDEYVKEKLLTPDIESKVRITVAITSLLLGPLDVGNMIISKEGIMEMILVMANTEEVLQQKVACECLIAAASKKDKAKAIINQGVHILKRLYKSKDDSIRVRALVGLCKLGSSGGSDASIQPFAEGSTVKLAEACRRFLINPSKDHDMRRWAVEGLSYLTLDADVKEKLVEDRPAIQAMIELAKTGDQSCLYGVVTTLVNLCNAYEKQEILPEMVELAKFAKHHIPEEHELDDPDFVDKRISILGKEGVTSALVALSKTESDNSKELIARVFNALCSLQDLRGIVVQQGGTKVLLSMSQSGTTKGKNQAAQALARIGITIKPDVAFPGERCLEVIKPLSALLHQDCSALENFESLMCLCNIAYESEKNRRKIFADCGLPKIEAFFSEDHVMLKRAAAQLLTNMTMSEDVVKVHEGENDRVKLLCLISQDEDEDTAIAAAGGLAVLTSTSKICCSKVLEINNWHEMFHFLLANPNVKIQYPGIYTLYNIMNADRGLAEKIIATDIMEILMALIKLDDDSRKNVKEYAEKCLKTAEDLHLIQKPGDGPIIPPVTVNEEDDSDME